MTLALLIIQYLAPLYDGMYSTVELDLRGVVLPMTLLTCKSTIARLSPGDALDVLMRDPETAQDLVTIIERSGDHVDGVEREGDTYRVRVRRRMNAIDGS